jgi:hypothetical protein
VTKIQVRRDSATNWTNANPTLGNGEIGFETDTLKAKIGNGSTAWTSLAYAKVGTADKIVASGVERRFFVGSSSPSGASSGDIWIKTA